jgi:hypothetical protein
LTFLFAIIVTNARVTTTLRRGKESGVDFRTDQSDLNTTKDMRLIMVSREGCQKTLLELRL